MPNSNMQGIPHKPVLYQEIIHALRPTSSGKYIDATVGAGGHASGILEQSSPASCLLGLDLDPQALEIARRRLSIYGQRVTLSQASYTTLKAQLKLLRWEAVEGILIDLGVSSMQVDDPDRGFSFLRDGPLDMRFDPQGRLKASDLVNTLGEQELVELLWRFGEEPQSRRIVRAILQSRPLHSTAELADVIEKASGGRRGRIHPATRTFQALRIAVNDELSSLEEFLPQAIDSLAARGRLAVISFHSLEDRLVKRFFRRESRDCICPPGQPVCTCDHRAKISEITRHPIQPGEREVLENPRARSARLRVVEKK